MIQAKNVINLQQQKNTKNLNIPFDDNTTCTPNTSAPKAKRESPNMLHIHSADESEISPWRNFYTSQRDFPWQFCRLTAMLVCSGTTSVRPSTDSRRCVKGLVYRNVSLSSCNDWL